ncbi:MAG: 30S ribosomal protein S16 [Chloroflexota bacterium]|nr:30S ribosomal protein S16 [Chloroflexota bacterium]
MVRIRLRRIGSKGKALYKIIVADQRSPQKGKYIEEVGTYDPHTNPASINLVEDKISDWISKGAQPSESVYKIFNIAGFDNGGKIKPLILKKKKAKKSPEQEAPTQEAPVEEAPTQEAPTQEAPTQEAPVEEAPVEDNKESEDK